MILQYFFQAGAQRNNADCILILSTSHCSMDIITVRHGSSDTNQFLFKVHIPVYIVVIATFVTILQFAMQAYTPDMYKTLGLFIPLIVVNCIVLGRAEAFACKNGIVDSALDGLGIGFGFTMSLTVLGLVREILGSGSAFGWKFISGDGILVFVMAPGAFIALGYLMVLFNKIAKKS